MVRPAPPPSYLHSSTVEIEEVPEGFDEFMKVPNRYALPGPEVRSEGNRKAYYAAMKRRSEHDPDDVQE